MDPPCVLQVLFQGVAGAERMVRVERPDGAVAIFEGVRGAERIVRVEEGPVVVRRRVVLARRVEPVLARRVDGGLKHAQ